MTEQNPARLLLINYEYPPVGGGGGNATQQLGRALTSKGLKVTVLTAAQGNLPRRENDHGVEIYRIWSARRRRDRCSILEMLIFMAHALFAAPGIARQTKANATLIFFGVPCGPVGWWLKYKLGLPYIISLQGGDVPGFMGHELSFYHRLSSPLIKRVWEEAYAVIANSRGLAALAHSYAPDIEVGMIPAGADLDSFLPRNKPTPSGPLRLLFVGRLVNQKGLDILFRALAALGNQEKWALTIAGGGPLEDTLMDTAQDLDLHDRITFCGWLERSQLSIVYNEADVFVLPSRAEGMPNAMLEAMAASLPVIGSRVAGIEEVVVNHETGLLVPPDDAEALTEALNTLLQDRDKAFALGQAARKRTEDYYSWNVASSAYAELLCGAVGSESL
ncbi:MAG: glycosyltransferase family 4 protein [Rhodospirillaceae bacterium]